MLAGVGLSWYTWLEQGRDITPSASVLDALARVLDLDTPERAHLFDLAGVAVPPPSGDYPAEAPPELRDSSRACSRTPPTCSARAPTCWPGTPRRRRCWAPPPSARRPARTCCGGCSPATASRPSSSWEETGRLTLARFRAEHARHYGDPAFASLIAALLDASPRFRELWPRHEVTAAQLGTQDLRASASSGRCRRTTCSRSRPATPTCAWCSSSPPTSARARRWRDEPLGALLRR